MQYTTLGKTDLKVSRLCLGCMTFGEPDREIMPGRCRKRAAAPSSSTPLTAASTSSIPPTATPTAAAKRLLAAPCEILPVVMTLWLPLRCTTRSGDLAEGLSRAQILRSIDDSLRRLNMDYVDLLQIHRWDYNTPIEETLEALNDVVKAGKARYIGASSMHASTVCPGAGSPAAERLGALCHHAGSLQPDLPGRRERDAAPVPRNGVAVIPWSPLARGRLTRPWGETTARLVSDEVGKNRCTATQKPAMR